MLFKILKSPGKWMSWTLLELSKHTVQKFLNKLPSYNSDGKTLYTFSILEV